jgi:hypothetical protein
MGERKGGGGGGDEGAAHACTESGKQLLLALDDGVCLLDLFFGTASRRPNISMHMHALQPTHDAASGSTMIVQVEKGAE